VRHLLQTEAGQQALKQAKVDYAKVDKAISQLSDDDLATVAEKSRQADHDFAAGGLSQTLIIVIVLIVILIVVLALVFLTLGPPPRSRPCALRAINGSHFQNGHKPDRNSLAPPEPFVH